MPGAEAPAGRLPAFAVDKMLGRLARWLRILGHDVAYGPHLSGRTLVDRARRERRLLLTRDTRLLRDPDLPPYVFVASDHFRQQLRQVADAVPLGGAFLRPLPRLQPRARARHPRGGGVARAALRVGHPGALPALPALRAHLLAGHPPRATCSTSSAALGLAAPAERLRMSERAP